MSQFIFSVRKIIDSISSVSQSFEIFTKTTLNAKQEFQRFRILFPCCRGIYKRTR